MASNSENTHLLRLKNVIPSSISPLCVLNFLKIKKVGVETNYMRFYFAEVFMFFPLKNVSKHVIK